MGQETQSLSEITHRHRHLACWVLAASLALGASARGERIIYVNGAAIGHNDGSTWIDAFVDLQDALGTVQSGDEVWVASGRYTPDRGTGDRSMYFRVPDGVGVYGGFAGNEECRYERDWMVQKVILTGDLNNDDGPRDCALHSDCCREHQGHGCDDAQCESRVCRIEPWCCMEDGGYDSWGHYCVYYAERECCEVGSRRTCENSFMVLDMSDTSAATTLDGVTVGGAFVTYLQSYDVNLGGICVLLDRASPRIVNVTFGDGSYYTLFGNDSMGLTIHNCEFRDSAGGAIEVRTGVVSVSECTFHPRGGGIIMDRGSLTVERCVFVGGASNVGSWHGTLVIRGSTFRDGESWAVVPLYSGALIENCDFVGNFGGVFAGGANATIRNSSFLRNRRNAISVDASTVSFENCVLAGDPVAGSGAVVYATETVLSMSNCTVVDHVTTNFPGGGLILVSADADIMNTVFRGNGSTWGPGVWGEEGTFYLDDIYGPATLEINHSIVDGWTGQYGGVGNSGADPMFVDPLGPDGVGGTEDDDLRLSPGSPAINGGDPNFVPQPDQTDLDGHARVLCDRVDIGAYEFGIGDFNCDQVVNLYDFAAWPGCMTGPATTPLFPPLARGDQGGSRAAGRSELSGPGSEAYPPACEAFDFNADGDVDLLDFASFPHPAD